MTLPRSLPSHPRHNLLTKHRTRCALSILLGLTASHGLHAAPPPPEKAPVNLLAADLPLPDGRLVPNFRFAGVPGGIPEAAVVARLEDFGAKPGHDISAALELAAAAAAEKGGGAVLIGPGEFFLDRPVHLVHDRVILRGSGMDATTLTFRWDPPKDEVVFLGTTDGETISPLRMLTIAAWNDSHDNKVVRCIRRLALEINGRTVAEQTDSESNEGPWFTLTRDNRQTAEILKPGRNTLRASVEYLDGREAEKVITVTVREGAGHDYVATDAAIHFSPDAYVQTFYEPLIKAIRRGDRRIPVKDAGDLKPGDPVMLKGSGGNWTAWPWHLVAGVEENTIVLASPVRLDMALESIRRMPAITGAGVEDLTLRQTSRHWTSLLAFQNDVACFVRRVRLLDAGRFPFTGGRKHFEMRDCVVDGAQFHFGVGGGTGYLGFSGSFDGLITGTKARRLRHAPNIQDGTMGCVIRDSVFEDSDAQYHSSPNWENLFENNVIRSVGGEKSHGSYGTGFYICARPTTSYGGRGNIFYRNDVTGHGSRDPRWPTAAITWEGGLGRDMWIAGNRFERLQGAGPLIQFGDVPTEVRISDNRFVDHATGNPLIAGNASKAVFAGNSFTGGNQTTLFAEDSQPAEWSDNTVEAAPVPGTLPSLNPPSIFLHQKSLERRD